VDGPTEVSLAGMKVESVQELVALETPELIDRLGDAPFPPSEKLIGAVLLKAVADLREATGDIAASSRQIQTAAWLTLAVALAALIVSLVAVLK
jgi:hypothetical protein